MWERKPFKLFLFITYSISVLFLLSRHEVWRDEVDGWLMVQELPIWEWRDYLRHSGHPGLFYLSLFPVAAFEGSFGIAQYLNCLYVFTAVGLLVFGSSLPVWFLGLAIFGDFFLYRFPVFTRNYALGFLLLTFVALWNQSPQKSKRIVSYCACILLAHTHILFTLVSISWGLFFITEWFLLKEKRQELTIVIISLFLSGLAVLYFIYPPSDGQFDSIFKNDPLAWRIALTYTLYPSFAGSEFFYKLSWITLAFFGFLFRKNISIMILYLSGIFLILFFFRFVYVNHLHHLSVLYVHFFFCFVFFYQRQNLLQFKSFRTKLLLAILSLIFTSQILFFIKVESRDIKLLYSGASLVPIFLKSCGWKEGDIIAGHGPDETKTILYYLEPKSKLYFPALEKYGSFMKWNKVFRDSYRIPEEVLLQRTIKERIQFLVWNQPLLKKSSQMHWKSCGYNPPKSVIDSREIFYVYSRIP